MNRGRALVMVALPAFAGLVLAGCGSDSSDTAGAAPRQTASPAAAPSSSPTATVTGTPKAKVSTSPRASAATAQGSDRNTVSGIITAVRKTTAQVSSPAGVVGIAWSPGTVIVDTVSAVVKDVRVGACVLVLPPAVGPAPTATTMAAGVVRLVASSPSCPPVPGATPSPADGPGSGGMAGSVTVNGGSGVIGSVSEKSRKGFTLRTRQGGGAVRTIAVSTSRATVYRKAGDHPHDAVIVGRCVTVWGSGHDGSRLMATRIRLSDPVAGSCTS